MNRVLAISLDGYENTVAEKMMAAGQLPAMARIRERSARFTLDHGSAKRTGLGAEHLSSGMSPKDANRWSSIHFDPRTYHVFQEGPRFAPFPSKMAAKSVVFDLPYFDLMQAPNVCGISAWGSHDAGTELSTNPATLLNELLEKHGSYPATKSMHALAWPSPKRCQIAGAEFVRGVELRSKVALWLLKERFPDWDLALIGVSEAHSAIEALWHGYDTQHPLHHLPSASVAGDGVLNVYKAIDRLIGSLASAFQDATIVIFSMHGMGPNHSDVASMVLLPELLHRHEFGQPFFQPPREWANAAGGIPVLGESEHWDVETPEMKTIAKSARTFIAPWIPKSVKTHLKSALQIPDGIPTERKRSLHWMPITRYQSFWPKMRAFALPSYYDGRIRINLIGRERNGLVPQNEYESYCEQIANVLNDCRNPLSGERVVDSIESRHESDPLARDPSEADMNVVWNGAVLAFEHSTHGRIGPIPYNRTGGHTGPFGMAYIAADEIAPGDLGKRSSFDVVPTLFDLLGERLPQNISGHSLLAPGYRREVDFRISPASMMPKISSGPVTLSKN
jgi:hypothetical protein